MNRRKIKLGVFIDQRLSVGGGYQQALNSAVLTKQLPTEEFSLTYFTTISENVEVLNVHGIHANYIRISKLSSGVMKLRQRIRSQRVAKYVRKLFGDSHLEAILVRHGVDLVYFTSPSSLANSLDRTNYIFTVWDLCHRDDPEFPEVRKYREFETREQLYSQTLPKAVAVIVDSETGRQNVIRRYSVDESRVQVIPFSPASGTLITEAQYEQGFFDVRQKYHLDTDYVFYPAQFWAHKNHIYLLRGLKILEEKHGIRVGALFSGGDSGGNLSYVKRVAEELGLSERVRYAGFVQNEEMPYLYRQSLALVMPTYFGPTNLPPLEAFRLGVPVLYPDKPGLKEQVGDASLLMDLQNPTSLADHLAELILAPSLRSKLTLKGKELFDSFSDETRLDVLTNILRNFSSRRACWD